MFKIPKQEYTAEFKELAMKRLQNGQGIGPEARDLRLMEQTLCNWVKATKQRKLNPPGGKAVTPEQMELSRVHAENAQEDGGYRIRGEAATDSEPARRLSQHYFVARRTRAGLGGLDRISGWISDGAVGALYSTKTVCGLFCDL